VRRPALGALAVALAVAIAGAGCGGGGQDRSAGLTWEGKPSVFRTKGMPADRVAIGRVRNDGSGTLHLIAANLRVRDADGHALKASAAFTATFAHGLFGALQQPRPVPPAELIRLGKVAYIPAGASVPFYAAWRVTPDTKEPVRVDYGRGVLVLPAATSATTR
jgi:hypothetical protein